jgi:hypothetical protein
MLTGCSGDHSPPSTAEIVGTYWGHYGDGDETIELRLNGTFSQTFQIGTNIVYTMNGKWRFEKEMILDEKRQLKINSSGRLNQEKISDEKKVVRVNRITFKPFMIPNGIYKRGSDIKLDVVSGRWSRNPVRIEFGPWPYFANKIAGQGAMTNRANSTSH